MQNGRVAFVSHFAYIRCVGGGDGGALKHYSMYALLQYDLCKETIVRLHETYIRVIFDVAEFRIVKPYCALQIHASSWTTGSVCERSLYRIVRQMAIAGGEYRLPLYHFLYPAYLYHLLYGRRMFSV